jgi:hypothetical protein
MILEHAAREAVPGEEAVTEDPVSLACSRGGARALGRLCQARTACPTVNRLASCAAQRRNTNDAGEASTLARPSLGGKSESVSRTERLVPAGREM